MEGLGMFVWRGLRPDGVSFSVLELDVSTAKQTWLCGPAKYKAALDILESKLVIISLHPVLCHSVFH